MDDCRLQRRCAIFSGFVKPTCAVDLAHPLPAARDTPDFAAVCPAPVGDVAAHAGNTKVQPRPVPNVNPVRVRTEPAAPVPRSAPAPTPWPTPARVREPVHTAAPSHIVHTAAPSHIAKPNSPAPAQIRLVLPGVMMAAEKQPIVDTAGCKGQTFAATGAGSKCGDRGIKLFKLHKVGSSTVAKSLVRSSIPR